VRSKTEMPGFIKPQLATLKAKAPKGAQWIHEIKFDGTASSSTSTRARRTSSPATGWTGPNAFQQLPALWISPVRLSSMAKWWSSMKAAPTFQNFRKT
jgi:bifunctional non-homologous end joining protein LigD